MGDVQLDQPFGDDAVTDIPLTSPPLIRVLCQLRFDQLAALNSPELTQEFAVALRDVFPFAEQAMQMNMMLGDGQIVTRPSNVPVWNLRSANKQESVSLTNGSLVFETSDYQSREDFCAKLAHAASILQKVSRVPDYTRVGVRFTNRISKAELLDRLTDLVRPQLVGISSNVLHSGVEIRHSLTQVLFKVDSDSGLLVQYGVMPPNGGFDPSLPVLDRVSWILDLDAFKEEETSSDPEEILREVQVLTARAYRFFRWAVTPEFLRLHGGQI